MPVIGNCRVCKKRGPVTTGLSILDNMPMALCNDCIENGAEPFDLFYKHIQGVMGKVKRHVKKIKVYYDGRLLTYKEAVEKVPL